MSKRKTVSRAERLAFELSKINLKHATTSKLSIENELISFADSDNSVYGEKCTWKDCTGSVCYCKMATLKLEAIFPERRFLTRFSAECKHCYPCGAVAVHMYCSFCNDILTGSVAGPGGKISDHLITIRHVFRQAEAFCASLKENTSAVDTQCSLEYLSKLEEWGEAIRCPARNTVKREHLDETIRSLREILLQMAEESGGAPSAISGGGEAAPPQASAAGVASSWALAAEPRSCAASVLVFGAPDPTQEEMPAAITASAEYAAATTASMEVAGSSGCPTAVGSGALYVGTNEPSRMTAATASSGVGREGRRQLHARRKLPLPASAAVAVDAAAAPGMGRSPPKQRTAMDEDGSALPHEDRRCTAGAAASGSDSDGEHVGMECGDGRKGWDGSGWEGGWRGGVGSPVDHQDPLWANISGSGGSPGCLTTSLGWESVKDLSPDRPSAMSNLRATAAPQPVRQQNSAAVNAPGLFGWGARPVLPALPVLVPRLASAAGWAGASRTCEWDGLLGGGPSGGSGSGGGGGGGSSIHGIFVNGLFRSVCDAGAGVGRSMTSRMGAGGIWAGDVADNSSERFATFGDTPAATASASSASVEAVSMAAGWNSTEDGVSWPWEAVWHAGASRPLSPAPSVWEPMAGDDCRLQVSDPAECMAPVTEPSLPACRPAAASHPLSAHASGDHGSDMAREKNCPVAAAGPAGAEAGNPCGGGGGGDGGYGGEEIDGSVQARWGQRLLRLRGAEREQTEEGNGQGCRWADLDSKASLHSGGGLEEAGGRGGFRGWMRDGAAEGLFKCLRIAVAASSRLAGAGQHSPPSSPQVAAAASSADRLQNSLADALPTLPLPLLRLQTATLRSGRRRFWTWPITAAG